MARFLELPWAAGGTQGDRAARFYKIRPGSLGWRRLLQTDFTFSNQILPESASLRYRLLTCGGLKVLSRFSHPRHYLQFTLWSPSRAEAASLMNCSLQSLEKRLLFHPLPPISSLCGTCPSGRPKPTHMLKDLKAQGVNFIC